MGKTFRVVVCGTKECGKTSIIEKAIYNKSGVILFIQLVEREIILLNCKIN